MLKSQILSILACLSSLAAVHAFSRPVHAAEVGYDTREQKFSGTIPHGEPFQITLWAKVGSSATIQYWPYFTRGKKSTTCDDKTRPPANATTFAARGIEVKDDNQKLGFDIPKLYPNQDYCFSLVVNNARPLDDNEKFRIATAVQKALKDLSAGKFDLEGFSSECTAEIKDKPKSTPQCVVVELFKRHLTVDLKVQPKDGPAAPTPPIDPKGQPVGGAAPVKHGLADVLRDALSTDYQLLGDLNSLYSKYNNYRAFQEAMDALRRSLKELKGLVRPLGLDQPVYAPPPKKPAKPPAKPPLTTTPPAKPDLPTITLPRDALDRLTKLGALAPTSDFSAEKIEFTKAFASVHGLLPCGEPNASPSDRYTTPGATDETKLAAIDGIWSSTCSVVQQLDIIDAIKSDERVSPSDDDIRASAAFMRMVSALRAVTVDQGPLVRVTSAGPRENTFPFYASVDIGLAPIIFSGSTVNLAQYFALNLYFTAVDPDEPLTTRRNPGRSPGAHFWRRLSISAGITTTGRQIENARNVTGLIGSQLPMLGLGFRIVRLLRVSGGIAFYNLKDLNPVVDKHNLSVAPYIALSLDLALFNWARKLAQ